MVTQKYTLPALFYSTKAFYFSTYIVRYHLVQKKYGLTFVNILLFSTFAMGTIVYFCGIKLKL